jgi:hypothetical protein
MDELLMVVERARGTSFRQAVRSRVVTQTAVFASNPGHPFGGFDDDMPSESLMPNDTAEIIRLLKAAEQRSKENITREDLTSVADTVTKGFREIGTRLDEVEGQVRAHAIAIRAIDERTGGSGSNISLRSYAPRRMSPMPQTIDIEKTAGGGIKITDGAQWEKIVKRLDDQEKALAEIEAERDAAKAAERTAQERQGAVTEYATKQRKLIKKLVAALIAGGPTLGAAMHYLLKWLHQ